MTDKIIVTKTETEYRTAGRPKLSRNEKTVGLHVTVTESQAEFLMGFGQGNISRGVRRLVDEKLQTKGKEEIP